MNLKTKRLILSGWLMLFCAAALAEGNIPKIWMSYRPFQDYETDFQDLADHGVEAVSARRDTARWPQILKCARKYGLKISTRVEAPMAHEYPDQAVEKAVMMGGVYQGKAIDRFRFAFTPEVHTIHLEKPHYHKENVYGTFGHYYEGLKGPIRAEVIVKQRDYDGQQHLTILPAKTTFIDSVRFSMSFDLSGIEGDLNHVVLAVYWTTHAARHRFRDNTSAFDSTTHQLMARKVYNVIHGWKQINAGVFPREIFAMRFGDESFYLSGHIQSAESVSYPLWDYSRSAVAAFGEINPVDTYPRGMAWKDMFGRKACADWMYLYHRANADLVKTVRNTLDDAGLSHVLVFRNITRSDVFSTMNDVDGTGLDLLSEALDVVHIDPYPVRSGGRYTHEIPVDMSYAAGLARRHQKYLIPWLQGHEYYPEGYFGLIHPEPHHVDRMMEEHLAHNPDGLMWLGYGPRSFYSFPVGRASWNRAAEWHRKFKTEERESVSPRFAVIRPYTVRALRDYEGNHPQDVFLTETVLWDVVMRQHWAYDPFEPRGPHCLKAADLAVYPAILAVLGHLTREALLPFVKSGKPCLLFIEGAEMLELDQTLTGINTLVTRRGQHEVVGGTMPLDLLAADYYTVQPECAVLVENKSGVCAWKKDNLVFIAMRSGERDAGLPQWLWHGLKNEFEI